MHDTWLWTCGGKCFGYRDGDDIWSYSGYQVGRFQGDEAYGPDGCYLGELMNGDRLIANRSKTSWRGSSFAPWARRGAYADYAGYATYAGYGDFPSVEQLTG